MRKLLITRPTPDGESTCKRLTEEGFETVHSPLLNVEYLPDALPLIPEDASLAFTSANGVRAYRAAGGPARESFFVGDATAKEGQDAGLPSSGNAQGDVDQLFKIIHQARPKHLLHIAGQDTIGALVERLKGQEINADRIELYRADKVHKLPSRAITFLEHEEGAVSFFSPRTAEHFVMLAQRAHLEGTLTRMTALCLSENVAKVARSGKFHNVLSCTAPNLEAFVDLAKFWRS